MDWKLVKERLSSSRLEEILHSCQAVKVGVVGDFTLDAYWYADMTGQSSRVRRRCSPDR